MRLAQSNDDPTVFSTPEWKLVAESKPLLGSEITRLRANIANASCLLHWIICMAETIQVMVKRQQYSEECPDYYYQKNYTSFKWSK